MPDYPDNRKKHKGMAPWDFAPGTPHADNPTKPPAVVYNRPAIRSLTPPRESFRVKTAPPPPEPAPVVEVLPPPTIPEFEDAPVSTMPITNEEKELD